VRELPRTPPLLTLLAWLHKLTKQNVLTLCNRLVSMDSYNEYFYMASLLCTSVTWLAAVIISIEIVLVFLVSLSVILFF
jgi:hypothetical protein